MFEKYFLDIPIYRCNNEKLDLEMENKKEALFTRYKIKDFDNSREIIEVFNKIYKYIWKYNEIVGWISLFVCGGQIRGDYYYEEAKRIRGGIRRKKFEYQGKAFESGIYKETDSDEQIYAELRNDIFTQCYSDSFLKNRHIDFEIFDRLGKYIRWRQLLEDLGG